MGVHLVNKKQEVFQFNLISWYKVLNLARVCGWCPAGTVTPADWDADYNWDGRYHSNDGQWVTLEDARGIAYALEVGLDDIPDVEVGERMMRTLRASRPDGDKLLQILPGEDAMEQMTRRLQENPFEYFSGTDGKKRLGEFITFCQKGGFHIW